MRRGAIGAPSPPRVIAVGDQLELRIAEVVDADEIAALTGAAPAEIGRSMIWVYPA